MPNRRNDSGKEQPADRTQCDDKRDRPRPSGQQLDGRFALLMCQLPSSAAIVAAEPSIGRGRIMAGPRMQICSARTFILRLR